MDIAVKLSIDEVDTLVKRCVRDKFHLPRAEFGALKIDKTAENWTISINKEVPADAQFAWVTPGEDED
jgi:hypothetical protein